MKDVLTYKDFVGSVHFSSEDNVFFGKIEGVHDLITFEADNVSDLIKVFKSAVNDYIAYCHQKKIQPHKSVKGNFNVRTSPQVHFDAMQLVVKKGYKSLNQYVAEAIEEKNSRELRDCLGSDNTSKTEVNIVSLSVSQSARAGKNMAGSKKKFAPLNKSVKSPQKLSKKT